MGTQSFNGLTFRRSWSDDFDWIPSRCIQALYDWVDSDEDHMQKEIDDLTELYKKHLVRVAAGEGYYAAREEYQEGFQERVAELGRVKEILSTISGGDIDQAVSALLDADSRISANNSLHENNMRSLRFANEYLRNDLQRYLLYKEEIEFFRSQFELALCEVTDLYEELERMVTIV
jgi:hypothetical protein